ncbi:MAG: hypothetical protein CXR31_05285 [Geobacter sp.]|nr:MAG: hypothetical protein CXR31_05285 [Geobacter sp.]
MQTQTGKEWLGSVSNRHGSDELFEQYAKDAALVVHDEDGNLLGGGGGAGQSIRDIARICPDATILEELAIRDRDVARAQSRIARWLRKLGM